MADVLIFGDTIRSPELRHEVPVAVPDPFIYVERDGSRWAFVGSLDAPLMRELPGLEPVALEELGVDELIAQGKRWDEAAPELVLRACRRVGVEGAVAPRTFPLEVDDHLRANDVRVEATGEFFDLRRRAKNEAELAGIRRAQRSCEGAMDAIRARLRKGERPTCEELRAEVNRVFSEAGMMTPDVVIVSHGAQTAVGHEPGSGPIAEGEPVVVDLYPRDPESGCFADMTRTFCVGEPPEELARYHGLAREALDLALGAIRPGIRGADVHRLVCEDGCERITDYPYELAP